MRISLDKGFSIALTTFHNMIIQPKIDELNQQESAWIVNNILPNVTLPEGYTGQLRIGSEGEQVFIELDDALIPTSDQTSTKTRRKA